MNIVAWHLKREKQILFQLMQKSFQLNLMSIYKKILANIY